MDSENKELEIVIGDDSELNISEVGDIITIPHYLTFALGKEVNESQ